MTLLVMASSYSASSTWDGIKILKIYFEMRQLEKIPKWFKLLFIKKSS